MPREHVTKVYQYSELSKKAKEKAREDWISNGHAWEENDSRDLTDTFKELLEEKGFEKGVEVYWSLGSSQGDGVAFTGSLDVGKYIKAGKLNRKFYCLIGRIGVYVKNSSRYTHSNSMDVTVEDMDGGRRGQGPKDWHPGIPSAALINEFEADVIADVKDISRELEKIGYAEIEYRSSEEYLADTFEANEYEFTEDGKFFRG